jgi:ubiquinone/menaquinone biosynthesis C-methylase UbiE
MKRITHQDQRLAWEREHSEPATLLQNHATRPSSSVIKFAHWLEEEADTPLEGLNGLEICCGKGRSAIWLATQGVKMMGIDFSQTAIKEARARANEAGVAEMARFMVQDAIKPYPFDAGSFDFAYDCFGSTDIESLEGRAAARYNTLRVLKPGGYLMVYLLGTKSEYQDEMVAENPGPEAGSFIHPVSGKFEKAFTGDEVREFYGQLDLLHLELVPKVDTYYGKDYQTEHVYAVFQKPN